MKPNEGKEMLYRGELLGHGPCRISDHDFRKWKGPEMIGLIGFLFVAGLLTLFVAETILYLIEGR